MKNKKLIVLVMVLIFVLLTVSTVSAKSERIEFTFTEECDWGTEDYGRVILNGQGNFLSKGYSLTCDEYGTIPQYTGTTYTDLNLSLTGSHEYLFFVGKGRMETEDGGVWNLNCLYPIPSDDAHCVGKGEGLYEGQQIFLKFYPGYGGTGYIVNHH